MKAPVAASKEVCIYHWGQEIEEVEAARLRPYPNAMLRLSIGMRSMPSAEWQQLTGFM